MIFLWSTLFVLGVLIFVHELGHFLAARSVGIRVEKFSIGFPPRFVSLVTNEKGRYFCIYFFRLIDGRIKWAPIFRYRLKNSIFKNSDTEYVLALIPLGGYVKMAGMIDESMDTTVTDKPDEFMSKSTISKLWVLSAGVIMNMVTAFFLFSVISYSQGEAKLINEPVISEIRPEMPAEQAGILSGDRIVSINGLNVDTWDDLTEVIHSKPNTSISLSMERGNLNYDLEITTSSITVPNSSNGIDTLGVIGITPEFLYSKISILDAINSGISATLNSLGMITMSLQMLFSGIASVSDLGGPIMIAQIAGETANQGWIPLLSFMALISVNLAFLNILPIPGLDGGHIFIILVEAIIRKPLTLKSRMVIQQVGMTFLLVLMFTVIFNDISRLIN